MTDKIQDRLLKASRYEVRKEAADYIDKLEAVVEKVAEAHFDLSLHKQHDTLTYLKKVAANALVNIKEEG